MRAAVLPEVIDAGRFRLRPFRADDAETVYAYANDDDYLRYLPIALPFTRESAGAFLRKQAELDRQLNPSWAIELDGSACGGLNIRFFAEHRLAEMGYAVARSCWGRDIATEAARRVVGAAFVAYPELARVRATADARNLASLRVMEKLGMRREGLLRKSRICRDELTDEVVCGLLRSEWREA
jgi:RimJ/RimL family protein N-acetyltransferase